MATNSIHHPLATAGGNALLAFYHRLKPRLKPMFHPDLMPRLQIIPGPRIRFHELPERRRTERLMKRIEAEMKLRHPPLVAQMPSGDYLLLDGANRVSALLEMGFAHVPVQVVDYASSKVQLKGWHHLLVQGRALELGQKWQALQGVTMQPVRREDLPRLLELREVVAVFVDETAQCWGFFPTEGPLNVQERVRLLREMVALYDGQSDLERVKLAEFTQLEAVLRTVEHQLCLYPPLHKEELLQLVAAGHMMPTGLTRHLIAGRALELNLPLDFLAPGHLKGKALGEAEANAYFEAFLQKLVVGGKVRLYEEAVFMLNE